jgi:hypothetical protein
MITAVLVSFATAAALVHAAGMRFAGDRRGSEAAEAAAADPQAGFPAGCRSGRTGRASAVWTARAVHTAVNHNTYAFSPMDGEISALALSGRCD